MAKYKLGSEESRSVAVKTVNNTSFDQDDVMREIELISKCSHKNIVEYIGHYKDPYGMHIVTEYMAGGDLHEYLINENNVKKNIVVLKFFRNQLLVMLFYIFFKFAKPWSI